MGLSLRSFRAALGVPRRTSKTLASVGSQLARPDSRARLFRGSQQVERPSMECPSSTTDGRHLDLRGESFTSGPLSRRPMNIGWLCQGLRLQRRSCGMLEMQCSEVCA